MASVPAMPKNSCHVRSISLPLRSHPLVARAQEEIKKLEAWKTQHASSSPLTVEMIYDGLVGRRGLYDCIEDQLHMSLAIHQYKKWADDALDGSVRLLDLCNTTREILFQMKEHMQSLRSALRRRGESSIRSSINVYISFMKMVEKDIRKCLYKLKEMDNGTNPAILVDQDQHMSTMAMLLRETRVITISFLEAILSFLSASRPNPKISKWSLVSRLMHKGRVASSDGDQEDANKAGSVDIPLHDLLAAKDAKMERVCVVQRRLEAFEIGIDRLEGGLESMFRFLIQNRVSLLNIFGH